MSPGGALGAGAFVEYRALLQLFSVSFGKKGTAAPSTGVGDAEVHGSLGTEVPTGVLHVPELAVSLFSVRAGRASGMAVPLPTHILAARRRHLHLQAQNGTAPAEGAKSPERRSVRADMQALAQACAAATVFVLPTPRSVAQVKPSEEWLQRELATYAKLRSFLDHGVLEDGGCVLPAGKAALPCHIMLDHKRDGRYKARLVARGNYQQPGVDFSETFACMCSYRTLHVIAAVTVWHGLQLQ